MFPHCHVSNSPAHNKQVVVDRQVGFDMHWSDVAYLHVRAAYLQCRAYVTGTLRTKPCRPKC